MGDTIYLDYAATSAVRPPEVTDAVTHYLREIGGSPGRSGHARGLAAGRVALRCRQHLAELLGFEGDPGRIVFQLNATHALNSALFGVLRPGDRVVRTQLDHNSVRRPLAALAGQGVQTEVLPLDHCGLPDLAALAQLLRQPGGVRLLVVPHASNVTGAVLPVEEMAALAHAAGALVLVDAAQTFGHYPIDVQRLGADLLAFTGHKGVPGPQGIGGLWVREGVELTPLLYGGSGGDSVSLSMPAALPDHLEAGTQNAPGIAGLGAAAAWVLGEGVDRLQRRQAALAQELRAGLGALPGVHILSSGAPASVGIVTLLFAGLDPGALALQLERSHGIQGRAGLHCAPDAHAALGTLASGAYRLSVGWATQSREIERTIAAFTALSRERTSR